MRPVFTNLFEDRAHFPQRLILSHAIQDAQFVIALKARRSVGDVSIATPSRRPREILDARHDAFKGDPGGGQVLREWAARFERLVQRPQVD